MIAIQQLRDRDCPICMEPLEEESLVSCAAGHGFHRTCVDTWEVASGRIRNCCICQRPLIHPNRSRRVSIIVNPIHTDNREERFCRIATTVAYGAGLVTLLATGYFASLSGATREKPEEVLFIYGIMTPYFLGVGSGIYQANPFSLCNPHFLTRRRVTLQPLPTDEDRPLVEV